MGNAVIMLISLIPGNPTSSNSSSGLTSCVVTSPPPSPNNHGLRLELLKLSSPNGTTLVNWEIRDCLIFIVSVYGVPAAISMKYGDKIIMQ
jgi:hypothetical protein